MKLAARITFTAVLLASVAACSNKESPRTLPAISGLETITVPEPDAAGGREWDGVVEAVRRATLSAQTNGRVAEVLHDVNDRVAAGDVLVRLTEVEQRAGVDAARAQLRAAEASAIEAEATLKRYLGLAGGQYVSRAQLDQARAARDAAVAAREAARAQVAAARQQTDYTTIRAPYDGIVATRDVEPGESVGVGQQLMTMFSPAALRIEVSVPQSEAEVIRADPVANVAFDDGEKVRAAEVIVFPAADAATHAVRVRVMLPALDPVPQPGTTAKVSFPAVRGAAFTRIPATALVQRGEVSAVYVVANGRVNLRQIRIGDRSADAVAVISGLAPGEAVATDPVAALQALIASRKEH